jgi:hypothetical protein
VPRRYHSCGKRYDWVASGETLARWSNQRRHWFSNEYENLVPRVACHVNLAAALFCVVR